VERKREKANTIPKKDESTKKRQYCHYCQEKLNKKLAINNRFYNQELYYFDAGA